MMLTLQGMRMRTEYMMECMRCDAIDATWKKFQDAAHTYYTNGYDNGETVKLIHELRTLGVGMDVITDEDLRIRDEVCYPEEV